MKIKDLHNFYAFHEADFIDYETNEPMTIDEAIKILRQHNMKGASVRRITNGKALEKDLLAQVLDSCEQLISEKAEYKRLLKAAVEDFAAIAEVQAAATPILCPQYGKYLKAIDVHTRKWCYTDEAEKLLNDEKISNVE